MTDDFENDLDESVIIRLTKAQILALMKEDERKLPFHVGIMSYETLSSMINILTEDQKNELSDRGLNPFVFDIEIYKVDNSPLPEGDDNE